jgi:hypothetical protein
MERMGCDMRSACKVIRAAGGYRFMGSWRIPVEVFELWLARQTDPLAGERIEAASLLRKVKEAAQDCRRGHIVYFIQSGDSPQVKIGTTTNLNGRVASMQVGNPEELTVLATHRGDVRLEGVLHQMFLDERLMGEWFLLSDRLEILIGLIAQESTEKRRTA